MNNTPTFIFLFSAGIVTLSAIYLTVSSCFRTGVLGSFGFLAITLGFGTMLFEALDGVDFLVLPQTAAGMVGVALFFIQHVTRILVADFRRKNPPSFILRLFPTVRRRKESGAALWLYLVAIIGIVGAVYGVITWVDHRWETTAGIKEGQRITKVEWAAANEKAEKEASKKKRAAELLAEELARQLIEAEGNAKDYERKYAAERAARKRAAAPLGFADCGKTQPTGGTENAQPQTATDVTPTLRLSWGFVRDYDAAWTGKAGQPIFGIQPGGAAASEPAGAPSPLKLDDVLDNHADNAALCSTDRRRLDAMINKIIQLKRQYSQ